MKVKIFIGLFFSTNVHYYIIQYKKSGHFQKSLCNSFKDTCNRSGCLNVNLAL